MAVSTLCKNLVRSWLRYRRQFWGRMSVSTVEQVQKTLSNIAIDKIRNFCIIAHIDHGKSTLADRLLEITDTIEKNTNNLQVLDRLKVERERGITVKAQTATMFHSSQSGLYLCNLIDTPGHVDFSYEVSKSMAACDGAVLLVDVTQGVQAQTVANFWLAFEKNLSIIPVLNKCDVDVSRSDDVVKQLASLFDFDARECLKISAKTGSGVPAVLEAIIERVPPPKSNLDLPLKALIFDSWYEQFRGCYAVVLVRDGCLERGKKIKSIHSEKTYEVVEVGILRPDPVAVDRLKAGQVGYILANMRRPDEAYIGDTLCEVSQHVQPFPGFHKVKPMVFAGLFPVNTAEHELVRNALEKLLLTDPSVSMTPDHSPALGNGWRAGFLGILHMEVFSQRLDDEHELSVILTAPSVPYKAVIKDNPGIRKRYDNKAEIIITSPNEFPLVTDVEGYLEPIATCTIVTPKDYYGKILNLCMTMDGVEKEIEMISHDRMLLKYDIPLADLIQNFFADLKEITSGYATMDYEVNGYRPADLVKLSLLVNGKCIEELSCITHREKAIKNGQELCTRLKAELDQQLYDVRIQAAIGKKIIAKESIRAARKDFTQKLKGNFGDRSRLMKLIERQKEGKRKMKLIGQVEIPKEAFFNIFKRHKK
ncbi:unnamed protein product [Soboliphyme baturini]|uniref:Translation factor GUF1 homolog, mitochondrial n=1 Tax=Soboliphyme baturini TaxID=241478 RepID=A0A183IC00_9BILA|nr:unnamed protein product [Soboliphyme baturini]